MFKNDNKIMNEKNFGAGGRLLVAPTNEIKNEVKIDQGMCVGVASSHP